MLFLATVEMAVGASALLCGLGFLVQPPDRQVVRTTESVEFGDRAIRIDFYDQPGAETGRPVVLLLHGVGGMLGDGALLKRTARTLALAGCRAGVVHYFNSTGTLFTSKAKAMALAPEWKRGIEAVIESVASKAPGRKIGLFGYSLGGFLGVAIAIDDPRICALAVLGGGILEERDTTERVELPPLLILHGERDDKVPIARSKALADLVMRSGGSVEVVNFPDEGHFFRATTERQVLELVGNFFSRHLL